MKTSMHSFWRKNGYSYFSFVRSLLKSWTRMFGTVVSYVAFVVKCFEIGFRCLGLNPTYNLAKNQNITPQYPQFGQIKFHLDELTLVHRSSTEPCLNYPREIVFKYFVQFWRLLKRINNSHTNTSSSLYWFNLANSWFVGC